MFVALQALLAQTQSLTVTITPQGGRMQVIVTPKAKAGASAGLFQPLVLSGTAAELDAEFVGALASFSGARKSLADQVAAANAAIEESKKAAATKAASAPKVGVKPAIKAGPSGSSTSESNDDDLLFGDTGSDVTPAATTETTAEASGLNIFATA